jgi:hypothetical protein
MATKLSRTIGNATPINYVGQLRYFVRSIYGKNLETSILDFGSNRSWRRVERDLYRQVEGLGFYDLNTLVAPDQRNMIFDDFMILQDRFGEARALEILRSYIVESYLCTELVRLAVDFSLPAKIDNYTVNLVEVEKKKKEAAAQRRAKELRRSFQVIVKSPAIQLPQVAPNAPNTAPALSLVAA